MLIFKYPGKQLLKNEVRSVTVYTIPDLSQDIESLEGNGVECNVQSDSASIVDSFLGISKESQVSCDKNSQLWTIKTCSNYPSSFSIGTQNYYKSNFFCESCDSDDSNMLSDGLHFISIYLEPRFMPPKINILNISATKYNITIDIHLNYPGNVKCGAFNLGFIPPSIETILTASVLNTPFVRIFLKFKNKL